MSENKLTSKFGPEARDGIKYFMWIIEKNNEREAIRRPPCYLFVGENRRLKNRLRSRLIHLLYCPAKNWRPHQVGQEVNDQHLQDYQLANLKKEFTHLSGRSSNQL